jgi:hypothetical protein
MFTRGETIRKPSDLSCQTDPSALRAAPWEKIPNFGAGRVRRENPGKISSKIWRNMGKYSGILGNYGKIHYKWEYQWGKIMN